MRYNPVPFMDVRFFRSLPSRISFRLPWFLLGVVLLSFLAWFVNTVPPLNGTTIFFMVCSLCITVFVLSASLMSIRHALLITLGLGTVLGLRLLKLYDPLYAILLSALLISLEYALKRR